MAKAQADRGTGFRIRQADRTQDMAGAARAAGAGAAEAEGDVPQLGEQTRGVETVAAEVEVAVIALLGAAIDGPARAQGLERHRP